MNDFDTTNADDFVLLLRNRTALGRLNDADVRSVLDFLESVGFRHAPEPVFAPLPAMEAPPAS